jgi:hypothetical protein
VVESEHRTRGINEKNCNNGVLIKDIKKKGKSR